jgi:hypothetical protein
VPKSGDTNGAADAAARGGNAVAGFFVLLPLVAVPYIAIMFVYGQPTAIITLVALCSLLGGVGGLVRLAWGRGLGFGQACDQWLAERSRGRQRAIAFATGFLRTFALALVVMVLGRLLGVIRI